MTTGIQLCLLAIVVAVHGAALGALHVSMIEFADQEKLALNLPPRVVVIGSRAESSPLATSNCPAPAKL